MSPSKTFTVVQLVAIDETGDSYYRMRWPGKHLAEQEPRWRILNVSAQAHERFLWAEQADLLVLFQTSDLDLLPVIEKRKQAGKKTLVEYNDNFYAPPPASPAANAWGSPLIWQTYEQFMNVCDTVIVTGPGLEKLFSKKTSTPIVVLENQLPESPEPFARLWQDTVPPLNLGWAGSLGHMADFLAVIPILKSVLEKHPEVTLHVMGNESIPKFVGLPPERFRFTKWGSMSDYYRFLKPLHIGIAPLRDTAYNDCRSDIKAVELSAHGVLPILSEALPYLKFIAETETPSFKNLEDLGPILSHAITHIAESRSKAERCHKYVREKRVGANRQERLQLYTKFLPNAPGHFSWDFPHGYHEVQGSIQSMPKDTFTFNRVQELLQHGKRKAALSILQHEIALNPFHPGLALAELKLLASSDTRSKWLSALNSYLERFPDDLRFYLLRMGSETSEAQLEEQWLELIGRLVALPENYRAHFAANIISLYCQQLPRFESLVSHGQSLLEIYPESAAIRFSLAEFYEKRGDDEKSYIHFCWLLEARRMYSLNQEFFASSDLSYVRTWKDALEERLRMLASTEDIR